MTSSNGTSPTPPVALSPLETAIWRTIAYVDVFDYPLTPAEIHHYLEGIPATLSEVETALGNGRLLSGCLTRQSPYFMLAGREEIGQLRRTREAVSQALWPGAMQYGRLIASLPFVRMVAVTGSLAVNNITDRADIDFLIVTRNGRVWLTRAFIIAIVRLAARRGWALCPNYILSESALVFAERNLYTAHELVQMVPLHGLPVYRRMRHLNPWVSHFMPNAGNDPRISVDAPAPHPVIQTALELPWRTPVGEWVDNWEMARKIRKFSDRPSHETNFSKMSCKGHFDAHEQRVLAAYHERSRTVER